MDITPKDLGAAFDLLRKKSTIPVVAGYLKRRELPVNTNSWPLLYEKTLVPLLRDKKIDRSDILRMLRDAEEFGKQHVFLYSCSKSQAMGVVNENTLKENLARLDLTEIMINPRIVLEPKGLQLVEARIDVPKRGMRSLVLKAVDTRSFRKLLRKETNGNFETEYYEWEHERAVHVVSVREDGVLEVRVQSFHNSIDYEAASKDVMAKTAGIIDEMIFNPVGLSKARITLVRKRKELRHLVRFADNRLRDREGRGMSMESIGRQQDLYADGSASDRGVEAFLSVGIPSCDEIDCFWVKRENTAVPSMELHTLIKGAENEFALTNRCDREDYEYALAQILNLTK